MASTSVPVNHSNIVYLDSGKDNGAQLEDGFFRVANALSEALMRAPLTARQYKVVMAVMRLTYGFNRSHARITGDELAELTGLTRPHAAAALGELLAFGVIERKGSSRGEIGINNYPNTWNFDQNPLPEKPKNEPKQNRVSDPNLGTVSDPNLGTLDEVYIKNNKDNISIPYGIDCHASELARPVEAPRSQEQDTQRAPPPPKSIPWEKQSLIERAATVIRLLNDESGHDYKARNPQGKPTANAKTIMDRIRDGYDLRDFIAVIDLKGEQWGKDDKMSAFLRPSTLFRKSNFETYLGQAKREQS